VEEFEAESVSFIVCTRFGLESPSARYLSAYEVEFTETPAFSPESVMKVAGLIEQTARGRMSPRKEELG
jgi:hypothetical protein